MKASDSVPTNAEIIRAAMDGFNQGDLDGALELAAEDITIHDPDRTGEVFRGKDAYVAFTAEWLENWDEYRIELEELREGPGDWIVAIATQSGRGKGSGIEISDSLNIAFFLRDGRIAEYWIFGDAERALRHAGIEV